MILARNRPNYLAITLTTLNHAIRKMERPPKVFIFNGGEPIQVDVAWYPFVVIHQGDWKDTGINNVYVRALKETFALSTKQFVMILDSDAVVHPEMLNAAEQMLSDIPQLEFGSVFNAKSSNAVPPDTKYFKKHSLGALGSMIRREVFAELYERGLSSDDDSHFEREFSNYGREHDGNWCTTRSYIEHIGFTGLHTDVIDRAINFLD